MLIPYEKIAPDALYGLIESFVLREGTDYGDVEITLEDKVEQVRQQLALGDIVIEYSEEHESINIVTRQSIGL